MNYISKMLSIDNVEEVLKSELEFDMKVGAKNLLPSFIGELIITDPQNYFQTALLRVTHDY